MSDRPMPRNTVVGYAIANRPNLLFGAVPSKAQMSDGSLGAGTFSLGPDRNCTIIGRDAGELLTTGHDNVLFGSEAGRNIVTGHHNICIGSGAGKDLPADASYMLVIGDTILTARWWQINRRREHRALLKLLHQAVRGGLGLR